jgi:hypothetical protein
MFMKTLLTIPMMFSFQQGEEPCQRIVIRVPHGTDVSMVPKAVVTLETVRGICLFYNQGQDVVAQEAARLLETTLLEGEDRVWANHLSHQSFLNAVGNGKDNSKKSKK